MSGPGVEIRRKSDDRVFPFAEPVQGPAPVIAAPGREVRIVFFVRRGKKKMK